MTTLTPPPANGPNRAERRRAAKGAVTPPPALPRIADIPDEKLQRFASAVAEGAADAPAWEGPDPEPIVIRAAAVTGAQMEQFERELGKPFSAVPWNEAPIRAAATLAAVVLRETDRPLTVDEIMALPGRALVLDLAHSPRVAAVRAAIDQRTQAQAATLIQSLLAEALEARGLSTTT